MATRLEFKAIPKSTEASVLAAYGAGQSAEIVLFPGVRYKRPAEAAATAKRHSSHRDTLELEG